ncbi:MAG: hypothetical protein ACYC56_05485 [Candidatus Aquicultor sp.]
MAETIEEYLRERYAERLVSAREADEIMRPIIAFARGHMTHTQSLLARWPDFGTDEERYEAVRIWYNQIEKRMEKELDKWFQKDRSPILRSEYIAACFREAIAAFLGDDARSNSPQAKLARERLTGRAVEIADLIASRVSTSLRSADIRRGIIIIVIWGEHGAHFPDS